MDFIFKVASHTQDECMNVAPRPLNPENWGSLFSPSLIDYVHADQDIFAPNFIFIIICNDVASFKADRVVQYFIICFFQGSAISCGRYST